MKILLDTSGYSAFFRNHSGIKEVLQTADHVALSLVVLGELRAGFRGGRRVDENERELNDFIESPRVEILPMDEETSRYYATIAHGLRKAGTPIPTNDIWIAATAMQFGLPVVTTDRDFEKIPQIITQWFDPAVGR